MLVRGLIACSFIGFAATAALWGCGGQPPPDVVRLDGPVTINVAGPVEDGSDVRFVVESDMTHTRDQVAIALTGLRLDIERTPTLARVSVMQLPLAATTISANVMPPAGMPLGEMLLGAMGPLEMDVVWASEDQLTLTASVPLRLRWSMMLPDAKAWNLEDQTTEALVLQLDVTRATDGQELVHLSARCDGTCLEVPSLLRISDLAISATAPVEVH